MSLLAPSLPMRARAHPRTRALRLLMVAALALSCVGCAKLPALSLNDLGLAPAERVAPVGQLLVEPRGPGAVFATIEGAAVDALSYSFLASRQTLVSPRAARGGGIHAVDGGYSYDEPTVATDCAFDELRYRLEKQDVAHFRHDPDRPATRPLGSRRGLSRKDRRFVDLRDPVHRPLYLLTSSRFIRVYPGSAVGTQTIARVQIGTRPGDQELRMTAYVQLPDTQATPLALQPGPR